MSLRFHKKKKKTDLVSIDVYGSLYLKNIFNEQDYNLRGEFHSFLVCLFNHLYILAFIDHFRPKGIESKPQESTLAL